MRYSNTKSTVSSNKSGNEQEKHEITQKDELPGVDYKSKLGPSSIKHQTKLNLTSDNGSSRFLGSVKKELSKKSNILKFQTAYQTEEGGGGTELASKSILCTNQDISIHLSSPLSGITTPHYINKNQNTELVKELTSSTSQDLSEEEDNGSRDDDKDAAAKLAAKPSVLAVNLKWKPGITLRRCHKYSTKMNYIDPLMRKTEFDYETKTKFENQVDSVCDELFPERKRSLMILDGNNCHYVQNALSASSSSFGGKGNSGAAGGIKMARSERLQEEATPSHPHKPDPFVRQWKEYSDLEEHKILIIPRYSKSGFDMDITARYQLPYQAKFVIGRKAYHHKFNLQLPLSKAPQHFGLIFTFSDDPKGHSKIRIKSLLSVYSVFPVTTRQAFLETYESNPDSQDVYNDESGSSNKARNKQQSSSSTKRNDGGAAGIAAKNATKLLTDNLQEENLLGGVYTGSYHMEKQLPQPGENDYRYRRLMRNDYNPDGVKQKKKNEIKKNIKKELGKY